MRPAWRGALGTLGVVVAAYGGWLLVDRTDTSQLLDAAVWLVAGVLAHDALLSAVILVAAALSTRVLPSAARAPAAVGLVVLGSLTLVALPMLGRFGARDDNPTLLDRPYLTSWALVVALTAVAVTAASLVRSRWGNRPPAQED